MPSILIKPYEQIIKYTINHIEINVSQLELNISALITTSFFDDSHTMRRQEIALMDGEDYRNWTSDSYLLLWVCNKYNIILQK